MSSKKVLLDEVCGTQAENYTSKRAFQNHHRTHAEKDCACDQCGKNFKCQKKLQDHKFEVHNSQKSCQTCSKTFTSYTNLKKHEQSHKPSVFCEKCNKSFPTKYKYNEHQKICSRGSPVAISEGISLVNKNHYQCDQCAKSYSKIPRILTPPEIGTQSAPQP